MTLVLVVGATMACPTPPRAVDAGATVVVDRIVDAGTSAPRAAAVPSSTLGAPDDSSLWEELRKRANAATVDALRACTSTEQCATVHHFTRCCTSLSVNAKHVRALERGRAEVTRALQTPDELRLCQISSCSGVLPPSTCAAGRCVVDPERALWLDVARVTSTRDADAMRACAANDDCVIVPHPTQCCRPAAVARAYEAAAKSAQSLMPPDEVRKCAIKDCAIRGEPACVEGLCRVGHR